MKIINKFLLLAVFICTAGLLMAQSVQMPKWPFNGKEVDFVGQQVANTSASLATPKYVSNGYYGRDNNLLFHIIDNNLWWGNGTYAGPLFEDVDPVANPDKMFPEIIIVPTDTLFCEEGSFYAFYSVDSYEANSKDLCKKVDVSLRYSLITPNSTNSGIYSESNSILTLLRGSSCQGALIGIAATDFLPGTNTRRLYAVYYDDATSISKILFYTVSPTGISEPNVVGTAYGHNNPFEPCEVEISSDNSKLVFTRNKMYQWEGSTNTNDVTVVHLLSTGFRNTGVGTNGYTYIDLGPVNSTNDYYVGVEFSHDMADLYVTGTGAGLYRYNFSSQIKTLLPGTVAIACSQLEMARDGYIYGVSSSGQLYAIDAGTNFFQSQYNITPAGVIDNKLYHNPTANGYNYVYTLPEQIDGYNYDKLWGNEETCCYIGNQSAVKLPIMAGVSENSTTGDITITGSNVSWTTTSNPFTSGTAITDIYLRGNLKINNGAKLTITGLTLHFKEAEVIQMSYNPDGKGSRLVLNNSKLTAFDDCDEDVLWGGIRCSGYWAQAQGSVLSSKQPYTYMVNSTIEYATVGVEANTGGILRAFNSSFKDNIKDVKFASFTKNDNISEFSTCNFYTTQALYDKGYSPVFHAEIWTAPGVSFKACNFSNDYAASVPLNQWGVGVLATESSVTVDAKCTVQEALGIPCPDSKTVRGTFTNLYYGIKANIGGFITISRQDFNNCLGGAWLVACNAITVTENDFDVSSLNPDQGTNRNFESYGLYVANSSGYHIEQNEFHDGLLGMVVYASGGDENFIYRNNFKRLSGNGQASGFVGIGVNYDYDEKYGLQLLCNEFDTVDYAMTVLGGDVYSATGQIISVTQSDIRSTQGMEKFGYDHFSTHNHFSGIPLSENRFFVVDPNVSLLSYYDYNHEDVDGYRLGAHSSNIRVFYRIIPTCPQTIYSGGVVIGPIMSRIGGSNNDELELENQLNSLNSYNYFSLSISAQSANENNAAVVYSQLSASSPYLSSEILLTYLSNPNVPDLSKVSLMLANSPLPTDVVEAVEKSDLSDEYIFYILNHQVGVNEIEQLQNQIRGLQSARQVNYDHLMRATFNADTTAAFAETYNYVMEFMQTQTDYHAKNRLVDMYMHKGMYDEALKLLSLMESSLAADDFAKVNDIHLTEIRIDILQNIHIEPIVDIVKKHDVFLSELAADYNTKEGGVARAILESAGLMENFPIVFLPNPEDEVSTKSLRISEPEKEPAISGKELVAMFELYPNPANDYLSLEFINPEGNCSFNIYTLKGDLVKTISSNQQLGFISINISNLLPGNYIINCPELKSNKSFMIVR